MRLNGISTIWKRILSRSRKKPSKRAQRLSQPANLASPATGLNARKQTAGKATAGKASGVKPSGANVTGGEPDLRRWSQTSFVSEKKNAARANAAQARNGGKATGGI